MPAHFDRVLIVFGQCRSHRFEGEGLVFFRVFRPRSRLACRIHSPFRLCFLVGLMSTVHAFLRAYFYVNRSTRRRWCPVDVVSFCVRMLCSWTICWEHGSGDRMCQKGCNMSFSWRSIVTVPAGLQEAGGGALSDVSDVRSTSETDVSNFQKHLIVKLCR